MTGGYREDGAGAERDQAGRAAVRPDSLPFGDQGQLHVFARGDAGWGGTARHTRYVRGIGAGTGTIFMRVLRGGRTEVIAFGGKCTHLAYSTPFDMHFRQVRGRDIGVVWVVMSFTEARTSSSFLVCVASNLRSFRRLN